MSRQKANHRKPYFGFAKKQFTDLAIKLMNDIEDSDYLVIEDSLKSVSVHFDELLDLTIIRKALDNRLAYLERFKELENKTTLFL